VRGKAGIFLQRTPTVAIFKFPVLISSTPAGASQLGVGGGGGDHQRSLIPARGGGTDLPTQNNLSTCKPSPSLMWAGGGGADLGGSGQARAIRWAFFSNFPTA
jgi:hypothetical protein